MTGEPVSETKKENRVKRLYERALQTLDETDMDLSDMESLIQKLNETKKKNPKFVQGTYLDKENRSCPFNMCNGSRGLQIVENGEGYGRGYSIQCPCVTPTNLRDYRNRKPSNLGDNHG